MALTLKEYADYLDTRTDLHWPQPPQPVRPGIRGYVVPLPEVRLISWSIYGTLLAIRGGELYYEDPQPFVMEVVLDKTVQEFKMWEAMTRKPERPGRQMARDYHAELEKLRSAPSPGESHPEIRVEKIWEQIIRRLQQKEYAYDVDFYGPVEDFAVKVAYFFHRSLQGTAAYPRAAEILMHLAETGYRQGVVDNGQVFTQLQLERALRRQAPTINIDRCIAPELRVLSYQVGARKPSTRPFEALLRRARQHGISPAQILHVGSSMERDIIPAKRLGMRAALFAGDTQSLQGKKKQLKDPATQPDLLITKLKQIPIALAG